MSDDDLRLKEFERSLYDLTPLEAKLKALGGRKPRENQSLADLVNEIKKELVAEGYPLYSLPYEPVEIRDDFITFTDDAAISAMYQSRYLPVHMHTHDYIEVIYVYQGHCTLTTAQGKRELQKGDLCIVSPACRHDHGVQDDSSINLLVAIRCDTFNDTFSGLLSHQDILSEFFLRYLYNSKTQHSLLFRTGDDSQISWTVVEMLHERLMDKEFRSSMLDSLLTRLFLLLLRNHKESVEVFDSGVQGTNIRLVPVLRHIQDNLKETTLKGLAQKFGYSETSLSKLIKHHTGKGYSTIVRELKAKKAAELLMNPQLSMFDLCDLVGYCDVSHLYKDFKWYHQVPPGEYRKAHGGAA